VIAAISLGGGVLGAWLLAARRSSATAAAQELAPIVATSVAREGL
jgi:hypothetical protein